MWSVSYDRGTCVVAPGLNFTQSGSTQYGSHNSRSLLNLIKLTHNQANRGTQFRPTLLPKPVSFGQVWYQNMYQEPFKSESLHGLTVHTRQFFSPKSRDALLNH